MRGMNKEPNVCSVALARAVQWHLTLAHIRLMTKHEAALQLALDAVPEEVIGTLARLVREVRFGSIEIVVHEGRITQIERRERVRFVGTDRQR
jgi:hypothetical protein